MKALIAIALLAGTFAHAQTTFNLSPFNSETECKAAAAAIGKSDLACATTFTTKPVPVELTLGGLPDATTAETSAKITAAVSPAAQVWCRLDSWAPIACPQTFALGTVTPLAAGAHKVDYYVGPTFDVAKPTRTYSWTIKPAVTPPVVTTPAVTPLAPAPMPVSAGVSGGNASTWSGTTNITDSSGTVLLGPVPDPKGSGRTVNLARIRASGSLIYGGVRSEQMWRGEAQKLYPAHDYWMAFAVMLKTGEAIGSGDGDLLVFQTHTPASGDTQPDVGLYMNGSTNSMIWRSASNSKPSNTWNYVGGSNPDVEKRQIMSTEAIPPAGVWTRFVVHFRPGFTTAHAPRYRVWRANAGQDFVQLFDYKDLNTYNSLEGPSYPRIGLYKWSTNWGRASLAFYESTLFFGEGADLLEAGKAAVAALK